MPQFKHVSKTLMLGLMLSCAAPLSAQAAEDATKDLKTYLCKDFMRVGGSEREIAVAFLHGYLMGEANSTVFSTETALKGNEKFIDHCLDNPNDNAIEAMKKFSTYPLR